MEAIALLCDHAQVTGDGKLFISGANVNRVISQALEAPMPVNVSLAIVVTIPWTQTNQRHKLTVELIYEDSPHGAQRVPLSGEMPGVQDGDAGLVAAEFNAGRGPDMQQGEQTLLPVALPFSGFPMPGPGSYFFNVEVDGSEVARVPFRVISANSFPHGMGFARPA